MDEKEKKEKYQKISTLESKYTVINTRLSVYIFNYMFPK